MISSQTRPATLTSLLGFRAAERPEGEAYLFLADGGEEAARLTWGELDRRARAIAAALRESLVPGDRALLLYPPGLEFVTAFFGCLQAGVIAVPAYPPRLHDRSQARLRSIARDAEPRAALTTSAIAATLAASPVPELATVRLIATEDLLEGGADLPDPDPESVAFLQYTSGSTATPKGVMVTHANLVHNERMIGEAFDQDEDSVVVGWLPLYHDMGLIGNVLQPLHAGGRCVLMSPVSFLQRPLRWLEAVSRYRATTSGGPNFAYELCVRRIPAEQREGLDLSSWRLAFNGAEPVRAETLERFAETFAPCGFRAEAFYPCYGLAEATLFVTGGDAGSRPRVESLEDRRPLVSCGRAWGDQRVTVVDPELGVELPAGVEGEIWIAGPSVARGYWRNPEATERDFHARLADGEGPFLRTGDLGLLSGGELYVTGRIKDLIILRGRNHYPQDIELTAERSHPDLRPGGGAAFSVEVAGEERLVVVHEVERQRRSGFEELSESVRRAVAEEHEVQVHEVVLVRAGTIPKTSSGKVQRRLCRARYLGGELPVLGRSALTVGMAASGPELTREALAGLDPDERRTVLERWLRERAAASIGVPADAVDPDRPLTAFGLDSLAAMELKGGVEAALGLSLPLTDVLEGAGTAQLAGLLLEGESLEARQEPSGADHGRLSYGQKALWFLHRLAPEGGAYNIVVAARTRGLDPEALRRALTALVTRHAALRTVFPSVGDEPMRRVLDEPLFDFAVGTGDLEEEAYRPFDLENGPLLRVRVSGQDLLLVVHHIVADFASLAIMARELGALYGDPAMTLPDLPWTYADFVLREEEGLSDRLWERWHETLSGVPDLDLPTDRPRPPVQTWRGGAVTLELPDDGLRGLARERGATFFMALLAAFQAQLGRYSGQRDFAVGSPSPGRGAPEWAGLVGYFVNPLALRANLEEDPGFGALLDRTRRTVLEGLEGAAFPFPLLAERLRPVRDPARPPLFQTMFLLQRTRPGDPSGIATFALGEAGGRLDLGGVEIESLRLEERRAQLDLTLRAAEEAGRLRVSLEYNADLFDAATAGRMLGHLRTLLAAAVADPDRPLSLLPLLEPGELLQILGWGTAPEPPMEPGLLHRRFEEQAALTPDAEALVAGEERLTYAELNRRANRLARHLRELGVGPEVRVGVSMERSAGLVVALLGVLKAGGAYVPLDPAYPQERLDLMREDSGAKLVIRAEDVDVEGDGSDLEPLALPGNLAYLIYTSGSTGRPKAVAIEHRSASVLVGWAHRVFGPETLAGVLASTSIAFDLSVFELFVPLSWGGRVILAANALELPRLPAPNEVTLVNTVPSALAELVRSHGIPASVRTINLAGEPVPPSLVEALAGVERLYNLYGPSEDTTYSTYTRLERGRPVTIGRPLDGTQAYVLDAALEPVPAGVPGELYLGGEGLARGYLGRPELTAERFVPDPFGHEEGARLYRTGDLVRWRDGELDFLGRVDHQVKVRGFRIELGEIEAALARQPGVRDAVVAARGEGEGRRLVAWVVGETEGLRDALRRELPEFMVPAAFVRLDALPLSPNGKVDRKALPDPEVLPVSPETPRTLLQELLAGVLAEVLGVERVGLHDDFFDLGGHSLLATRAASRVSRLLGLDLPVSALFQEPTVAGLASRLEGAGLAAPPPPPILPARRDGPLPLSFAQRRIWLLDQLQPGSAAYNLPGAVHLAGPLDVPALEAALAEIVGRHEALRTIYPVVAGEPVQAVGNPAPELPHIDLGSLPDSRTEADRLAREEARTPFDLVHGPVCRTKLVRLGRDEHLLLVTLHHIAADGWSLGIFLRELAAVYPRYEPPVLPDLPAQYADYAVWQREWLREEALAGQLAYWRERLAGLPVLDLPADRPRPGVRDLRGATRSRTLQAGLLEDMARLARREGVTPFMALLAAFQTLLARYTGEDAVPVGSPVANRRLVEIEPLIGCFVNTLVLDARLGDDPGFRDLLPRVREACLGAYAHQDIPFESLVEELQPDRDLSQNPLFQVMFVVENSLPRQRAGGLSLVPRRIENGTAKFDLLLALTPLPDGGWQASAEHSAALFDPATMDRLLGHWHTLLAGIAADPGARLSALPLLTAPERGQVLGSWNDSGSGPAPGPRLHDLVAAQAGRTPDAEAVVGEDGRLTYRELVLRARRIAARLRVVGVGPEARVGLCVRRSVEMVPALLGVLEAGGAYVPLDPAYPQERLELMLSDSGARVLLTERGLAQRLSFFDGATVYLDEIEAGGEEAGPGPRAGAYNLAYLIYTSGSTGRPKGVAIEHRSAVALVEWALGVFPREDLAGVLAATSICFDLSVFEIFVPLAVGGKVIVAADALALPRHAAAGEVTLLNTVPSAMTELARGALPSGLRTVNLAGEALKADLVERIYAHPQVRSVYNLYGPSEDTTYSTFARIARGAAGAPPIGRPIDGTQARVVGRWWEALPAGVHGELLLGGAGLARGYLGRPELTAERFVPDPFGPAGSRLYRTGDRVRRRPDGQLDFLGRFDHQVKLRGFRIELGEIEAELAACPGVLEAAVLVRRHGGGGEDQSLVAYVAWEGPEPWSRETEEELSRQLAERLPAPMIPSRIVGLDRLPLTPNGKVDRRALARVAPERAAGGERVAPRTPLEEALAGLWLEVLGAERTGGRVGVHDDFFELGGHSLAAARLASRIGSSLGVELPLRALFETPTVARLAARLEKQGHDLAKEGAIPRLPRMPRRPGEALRFPASFPQVREWILDRLEPGTPAYNVPGPMRVAGPLSIAILAASLNELVRRHESLRTTFEAEPEEPRQVVWPRLEVPLPVIDLAGLSETPRETELRRLLDEDLGIGFDLSAGPLLRARAVRCGPEDHAVLFTIHHIVSDGWSMSVFLRELGEVYEAFSRGLPSPLPEPALQYPDFAAWQRGRMQGELLEEQVAYWRRQLAGAPPLLELPTDRPRPAVRTSRGNSHAVLWPAGLVEPLAALASRHRSSLFMALLAVYQAVLARLCGQDDVTVGTFTGNRGRAELEEMIGFFINTLALRTDLSGEPTFRELLARVSDVTLGAYAHQDAPFEKLLESLDLPRDPSRTPLFQTMLVLQNFPRHGTDLSQISMSPIPYETHRSNFDLTLWLTEEAEGLEGRLEYSTDLFDEATVVRLAGYVRNLVEAAAADPDRGILSLPLLPTAERAMILKGWSRTGEEPAGEPLLHRLFEAQAARSPEALAVEAGDERLTYAELDARADRLARWLRSLGVGPESRVALAVERSPEMLAGMLGVLKAGGAYVPLDPAYPQDRLAFMLEDAGAAWLLTQERLVDRLPASRARVVLLDREVPDAPDAPVTVDPENAAYVIYTSGSTGRPKGVVVSHRSIAAYTRTARQYYAVGPSDRVLQFGSISFDTSAEEIYPALIGGAALVLRSNEMALSISHFLGECERLGITLLNLQTAFWHEVVAGLTDGLGLPPALRIMVIGGEEALADRLAAWRRRVSPRVRLVNTYGPTEATIVSTYRELAEPEDDPEVPIGYAIPGARTYVLDRGFEPVPTGAEGELMIGGVGVARGYRGRPDLTAERFVPDPYSGLAGARLYRTGDLARFRPNGELLFRGRADRQLKLRGYRIEPGEIEAALRRHPALHDAVADLRGREDKRLVAWVVPREGQEAPPAAELRAFLRERLPEPMVPSAILGLAALPLTPSGKLDRRGLPEPEAVRVEMPGYAEPETRLERTIAGIFGDLLRVDRVGLNDNFFELGGHSLLVVRAHQRLREALGREIPVVDLFRFPTVALLARHLGGAEEEKPAFERVQDLAGLQRSAQSAQLRRRQALEKLQGNRKR